MQFHRGLVQPRSDTHLKCTPLLPGVSKLQAGVLQGWVPHQVARCAALDCRRRRGRTYEEDCLDLVKDLPGDQQRYMISGFAEYAERLA